MLVVRERVRDARAADESGAVLITVLIVMLVGFIVASVVAASVLFTVQSNSGNRSRTQAFIAAESGRDAARAAIVAGCGATTFTGTDPKFTSTIYYRDGASSRPTSATDSGVAVGCPLSTTTTGGYVVIRSTGAGPDGSTATIDSVFPWAPPISGPGGVVTYFAGGFTSGVSHYTGDLVLRDGDFSCIQGSTLDGDLYVLNGTVSFSNNCTINGDIWASGNVTNNSQTVKVSGSITTNGLVSMTANGNTSVGGSITAKGNVTLSDQGSSAAKVGGNVTSRNAISVGADWTVTGTQTPNSPTDPVFDPTLAWLQAATKWIDLDNTGWGTVYSATPVCNLLKNNPNPTIASLISTAGSRLVLDFTSCSDNAITIALPNLTVRRDVVIIAKPSARLLVTLDTTIVDDGNKRQLFFIHSDASRAYTNGAPVPNCGNGNQNDKFDLTSNVDANLRVMLYTACGFTGTVSGSLTGQFYTSESPDLRQANYTCRDMSWTGVLDQLGCKIKGAGGISAGSSPAVLGDLVFQTER